MDDKDHKDEDDEDEDEDDGKDDDDQDHEDEDCGWRWRRWGWGLWVRSIQNSATMRHQNTNYAAEGKAQTMHARTWSNLF